MCVIFPHFNTSLINMNRWTKNGKCEFTLNSTRKCIFRCRHYTNNFWNAMSFLIFHISETHNFSGWREKNGEQKKCKRRENSTTEEGFHISFSNFQLNERESGKIMVKRKFRNGDAKIARNERVQRTLCCEWNVRQAAAFLFPWVHLGFSSLFRRFRFAATTLTHTTPPHFFVNLLRYFSSCTC